MAQEQQQVQVRSKRHEDGEVDDRPEDIRDQELDEDVACCLGEIDNVLDEVEVQESAIERREREEHEEAKEAWNAIVLATPAVRTHAEYVFDNPEREGQVAEWRTKYGHLFAWCCSGRVPDFDRPVSR
jgi:hypothetical protein